MLRELVAALAFLTRLPVPAAWRQVAPHRALGWLPAGGLAVGALTAGVYALALAAGLAPGAAAWAAIAAEMLLTGALHPDGLADTADSLGGDTPERRLAIMKDPGLGTYGAVALILALGGRWVLLSSLPAPSAVPLWILAHAACRWGPVWALARYPYARSGQGTGMAFARAGRRELWLASATAVGAAWLLVGMSGLAVFAAAVLGAAGAVWMASRRLGGVTGDVCGAAAEVALLAGLVAGALTVAPVAGGAESVVIPGKSDTRAIAAAPGTWGELVQGTVGGEDFLVTCPVNLSVWAVARRDESGRGWRAAGAYPRTKAALAALPGSGTVRIKSPLRREAGMASSTADLSAALAAAAATQGRSLTPAELFARCIRIEPTDGLMFPGIALVDHRRGRRAEVLGMPPPLAVLGIDPGGSISTADFNANPHLAAANRKKEPVIRVALELAVAAIRNGDPAALGEAATMSALAHQRVLRHPLWEQAVALAPAIGALGINVAHSGVVLGFLVDPRRADLPAAREWLEGRLGLAVRVLSVTGGGIRLRAGGECLARR